MATINNSPPLDVLDSFGELKMSKAFDGKSNLYKLLLINNITSESKFDFIISVCDDILNGQSCKYSTNYIHQITFSLVNTCPDQLNKIIFDTLSNYTNSYSDIIQDKFLNDTFVLDEFVLDFKTYCTRTEIIKKLLWYYDDNVKYIGSNNNAYSYWNLMRNYIFYYNVINKTYTYKSSTNFFYALLNDILADKNMDFKSLIPLFKIYRFYSRLSHVVGDDRPQLFNVETDDKFLSKLGESKEFVKNLCLYFNKAIKIYKGLLVSSDPNDTDRLLSLKNTLFDMANIVKSFDEIIIFVRFYMFLLKERVFGSSTDLEFEKMLYNHFKCDSNAEEK